MKKITTLLALAFLLVSITSCSDDAAPTPNVSTSAAKEILKGHNVSPIAENSDLSRQSRNIVIKSIANTTWDFLIYNGSTSWHADVVFYANGTTMYDEPDYPGAYTNYGTWHQVGNVIYYDLGNDISNETYYFTGTINGGTMSGTYTFGTGPQLWTALKY